MTSTSGSVRTTLVPAAGTFPSGSPRTICTALMPTATLPAQKPGWSSTKTAASAATPSRSSAHRKISAAGLAAPTSHDRTRASASTSTPSEVSNGRVFSVQLLTTAILMPRGPELVQKRDHVVKQARVGEQQFGVPAYHLGDQAGMRLLAGRPQDLAERFGLRHPPVGQHGPERLYSESQIASGMPASAGTSRLSTLKSQVTIVS